MAYALNDEGDIPAAYDESPEPEDDETSGLIEE